MEPQKQTPTKTPTSAQPAPKREVTATLAHLLGETYALYFQTQSFHWNVRGPQFFSLHRMFEAQYEDLAGAVDRLAERIRALGALAPSSLAELLRAGGLPLEHGAPPARSMVETLLRGHERIGHAMRDGAARAQQQGDTVTHDLLSDRAFHHDKTAWMLRATLEE